MTAVLFTGLCTAILGAFFAFVAWRHSEAARNHHLLVDRALAKLLQLRGQIAGHDSALTSQLAQLQKLRGQFYALKAALEDPSPPPPPPPDSQQRLFADTPPLCENWNLAQREGPLSPAARCDCNYCAEMRHRRDLARKELIPKTAAAHARRTNEAAHGQE